MSVPGILQDAVEYYNTTAPKQQPQFAVQAALALGSVIMGRRWRTNQWNYSSLYFLNIGKSSTGKEHAKRVIENHLTAAGVEYLIGPSGYTSSGGVISALIERPCHITIIDEFGRMLESMNHSQNSNKIDAQTTIMEAFGRLDGTLRSQGYSSMTLTKAQMENDGVKQVHHPALTLLGITTPVTFYSSISSHGVKNGLVPRHIIVEYDIERQPSRQIVEIEISSRIIEFIKKCASATASKGNLSDDFGPRNPPDPVIVMIEPDAWEVLKQYDKETLKSMDEYEKYGLDEMFGKSKEIAQRLSMIISVSCESSTVKVEHVTWAIDYVRFYNLRAVDRLKSVMSDSAFEAACKEVLEVISKSGLKGATEREISRKSKLYRGMDPKQRVSLHCILQSDYSVEFTKIDINKAGRTRKAYVLKPDEDDDDE